MNTLTAARLPITTERLLLEPLSTSDGNFILELVNTEGWLKFIGDRNVHSTADATAYIEKIVNNPAFAYWTVKPRDTSQSIGIITFIKRDYLPHHDVGFAFLPAAANQGYAHEAARAVLAHLKNHQAFETILATTLPENTTSIKLLEKLGLKFDKDIEVDGSKRLHVYAAGASELN